MAQYMTGGGRHVYLHTFPLHTDGSQSENHLNWSTPSMYLFLFGTPNKPEDGTDTCRKFDSSTKAAVCSNRKSAAQHFSFLVTKYDSFTTFESFATMSHQLHTVDPVLLSNYSCQGHVLLLKVTLDFPHTSASINCSPAIFSVDCCYS